MKDNKEKGLVLAGSELKSVTRKQKFTQWWYGVSEPHLLRYADYMLRTEKRKAKYVKMKKPRALPAGIIISTEAACRFIDFIYGEKIGNLTARMAVTKCVCQTALKRCAQPEKKDMALLYTADMYTDMKHTGIKEKFEIIKTAQEAKDMVMYFNECGLMHNVFYCHASGKWSFVMCNCDSEICVPFRSYMAGRTEEISAGPEIVLLDTSLCEGGEKCGKCVQRCLVKACNIGEDGKSTIDHTKCLGCGLCVSTCTGKARTLRPRDNYKHDDVLTTKILLGKDYAELLEEMRNNN
ncbi:MAG: hypothetical protein R3Y32_05940 [Bacillota bacterium]